MSEELNKIVENAEEVKDEVVETVAEKAEEVQEEARSAVAEAAETVQEKAEEVVEKVEAVADKVVDAAEDAKKAPGVVQELLDKTDIDEKIVEGAKGVIGKIGSMFKKDGE